MKKDIEDLKTFSKTLKVLYVEDNKEARESTLAMLNNLFDDIIVANDGLDGLEKFTKNEIQQEQGKEKTFDLIISDINMPNMNGIEMCEQIKEISNDIPIIILSGHNESEYFMKSIKLGVDGYLLKPLDFDPLISVLYKIIKNIKNNIEFEKNIKNQQKYEKQEALNNMLNNIAHHWKQPLTVISLEAGLIKLSNESKFYTNESNITSSEAIIESVEVLNNIIKDFEKLFNSNCKNNTTNINLRDTIKNIIPDSKDIEIIQDIEDISIRTNQELIEDVIIAIFNNAKEAVLNNSKKLIFIDIYTRKNNLYITIKDNGLGIDKNIIDKIFEPYFTSKHKDFGTGLSLYFVHNIITKYLNGTIEVTNETYKYNNKQHKGAKFEIVLKV
ncbi:MAG: response regulator [Campylobacterota bacterium]|nr:response regulator [Campylobacterota bacterium]